MNLLGRLVLSLVGEVLSCSLDVRRHVWRQAVDLVDASRPEAEGRRVLFIGLGVTVLEFWQVVHSVRRVQIVLVMVIRLSTALVCWPSDEVILILSQIWLAL